MTDNEKGQIYECLVDAKEWLLEDSSVTNINKAFEFLIEDVFKVLEKHGYKNE